jgi:hypothetical protein
MPDRGLPRLAYTLTGGGSSPNPLTLCRYCGAPIFFRLTERGKWQPVSQATGLPHFAECAPWQSLRRREVAP